jgi:hypothetical protein
VEGIFFAANGSIALWRLPLQVRSATCEHACGPGVYWAGVEYFGDHYRSPRHNRIQRCNSARISASEKGVTWSADHGTFTVDLSETLIRGGILGRTEIRLTSPNYLRQPSASRLTSSFADPSVGLKEQIGPLAGALDLSVIIGAGIPLETDKPGRHRFSPFVKFPCSRELPNGLSVGSMQ